MVLEIIPKYMNRVVKATTDLPAQYTVRVRGQQGNTLKVYVADIQGYIVYTYPSVSIDADPFTVDAFGSEVYNAVGDGFYKLCAEVWDSTETNLLEGPVCVMIPVVKTQPTVLASVEQAAKVVVVDLENGIAVSLGQPQGSVYLPYGGRLFGYILYDDPSSRKGRIVMPDGSGGLVDTGWAKKVVLTISIGFSSLADMKNWIVSHALKNTTDIASVLEVVENANDDEIVKTLAPYAIPSVVDAFSGKLLDFRVDTSLYAIYVKVLVNMGWFDINWTHLAACAAWGGIVGAAFGGVVGAAVGALVGVAVSLVAQAFSAEDEKKIKELERQIRDIAEQGKRNVEAATKQALDTLDEIAQKYNMSEEDKEKLRNEILSIKATAIEAIEETKNIAVTNVKKAYEKGKKSMYKWVAAAGAGGLVVGAIVKGR